MGPDPPCADQTPLDRARDRAAAIGINGAGQQLGTRWPIGCVALEITQRCNLDCTLCYLSDSSEAVHDIPMSELFRRIELIHSYYGDNTDIQITGGDPTLRKSSDLAAIVKRARESGLRPTLMTNGIKASRELLAKLQQAGLYDVAFHVDTTQQRAGYANESALNEVRGSYIERARGLGLSVFFNTTVHAGNLDEIPDLVRFFRRHSNVVSLASFQLQADTGRGVWRQREACVTADAVARRIQAGSSGSLSFDTIRIGHPHCSRFAMGLTVNGRLFDILDDKQLARDIQQSTLHIEWDRRRPHRTLVNALKWLVAHPRIAARVLRKARRTIPLMITDLIASRFRIHKLSFVIHDFMDACALDSQRIKTCAFTNMTRDGPMSMCLYNAKREHDLAQSIPVEVDGEPGYWQPLEGKVYAEPPGEDQVDWQLPLKQLKGRLRSPARSPVTE